MAGPPLTPPGPDDPGPSGFEPGDDLAPGGDDDVRGTARSRTAERVEQARERTAERVEQARERTAERVEVVREKTAERVEQARLTTRRLFGIDRSGPPPPQTRKDQPWNVWTIPNAIGFVRLCLIPVFLVIAFGSRDGRNATAAAIFAVIAWSDYLDGFTARITGQYSRFGALLDPIVDRLLILSGVAVTWHFELLPRWALSVLAAREVFMLFAGRAALRRGAEIRINWPGRIGVGPIMSAPFWAMCGLLTFAAINLYIGLVLALWATALYVRDTRRQLAGRPSGPSS